MMLIAGIDIDYDVARAILVLHRSGKFDTLSIGRVVGESEPRVCRVIDAARAGFAVAVSLAMSPRAAPHPDPLPSVERGKGGEA